MKWQRVQTKSDNSEENSENSKIDLFFDNCKRHLPNPAVMIRTQQHPGQARARIISPAAGEKLIGSGWRSADLHVHTCYSYDVVPVAGVDPLFLYDKAKARGMSFITFTDHDTMKAYDRIGWTRDDVVTGVEVKILDEKNVGHTIHLNIYTLTRFQFKEIERIARQAKDIELLLEFLRSEKLPHIFNHPFWHEPGEILNTQTVISVAELFPVLEYNLGRVNKLNRMVLELASSLNKGIVAGTDTHIGDIGQSYTVAEGQNFLEFFEAVKKGQSFLISEDLTYSKIKQEMLKRLEMLIDNRNWMMEKDRFKMESGNTLVDAIIETLSHKSGNSHRIKMFIVKFLARTLSQTGIPAWVYLRQQNVLADRLEQELSLV